MPGENGGHAYIRVIEGEIKATVLEIRTRTSEKVSHPPWSRLSGRKIAQRKERQSAEAAGTHEWRGRKEWRTLNSQRKDDPQLASSETTEAKIERSTIYTTPRYKNL